MSDMQPPGPNPYAPPATPYAEQQALYPHHPRPNQQLEAVFPVNVAPLALIAGYLGLASVMCFPAPIALLLGIVALRDLEKNPHKVGKGRAWFAIVTGGLGTVGLAAGLVLSLLA